jgi:HAD superfamily hydrolase (TIGR01509 family)
LTSVPARPGVLFDVDGTLVDTNYLHTMAWARAFEDVGEWVPTNAIHRLIGMGGDQLVPKLLGHPLPAASHARERHYRELIGEARAFPGAADLLRRVHDEGLVVVIASSAPRDELDAMLEILGANEAIDATTSSDDAEASKPDPAVFRAAIDRGHVDRQACVVVGDSTWDVQAARAASLPCVGVETGGFSAHELREEGALYVYRDVAEILGQFHLSALGQLSPAP